MQTRVSEYCAWPVLLEPIFGDKMIVSRKNSVKIKPYERRDFVQIAQIYKEAFADYPWNEYKKCVCGQNYGRDEIRELSLCKRCGNAPVLSDFWTPENISQDIDLALKQRDPILLIASTQGAVAGFIWGYKFPVGKFEFLADTLGDLSTRNYLDDIAVGLNMRRRGIGTILCLEYLNKAARTGADSVVLRTDERNKTSMALFKNRGFNLIYINLDVPSCKDGILRDPEYNDRIYMVRQTELLMATKKIKRE